MNSSKPRTRHTSADESSTDSRVAQLLAQGDVEAASDLAVLSVAADRAVAKAARRALYVLSTRGIVPDLPSQPHDPIRPPAASRAPTPTTAYLAAPDPHGRRSMVFEQTARGGVFQAHFQIDYTRGIRDSEGDTMSTARAGELIQRFRSEQPGPPCEIPVGYALWSLQTALRRCAARQGIIPERHAKLIRKLEGHEASYERSLAYSLIDADSLAADLSLSRNPATLLGYGWYQTWLLPMPVVQPWAQRVMEASESLLVLAQHQVTSRTDRLIDEATDAIVAETGIPDYRERLEESAVVLCLNGALDIARQTLYHASTMEPGVPPSSVPWLREYVRRAVHLVIQARQQAADQNRPGTRQSR